RIEVPRAGGVELVLQFSLALEQLVHVGVRIAERVVDHVELFQQIDDRLHALLDDLANSFRRIELRLLFEKSNRVTGRQNCLAEKIFVNAGKNSQQRALARSIQTDDADLRAVEVRKVNVLENLLFSMELGYANHGIDDFV